jgi:energy-coupling factor transport system permease protein
VKFAEPFADPRAPLARRHPLAKLAAAAVLTLALVGSLDPVTPAVILAAELAAVPAFGLRAGPLLRRAWPALAAAVGAGASYLFLAERTGATVAALGPLVVTTGVLTSMGSLVLRLCAVALPAIAVVASTDPTELADGLIQHTRASPRFVLGALAAFRTLPLLTDDWEMLRMARRARGVHAGARPWAQVRLFASSMFALLVIALRRGTRLATAMDARGFDAGVPRGVARPRRLRVADAALVLAAFAVGAAAIALSVRAGTFRPLLR